SFRNDSTDSPLEPVTFNLRSASSSWTTATLKLLTSVIAAAMAGQMVSSSAPLNSREVMAEKRSNRRLSRSALYCMPAIDSDLPSTTARIIPRATKSLGVFHSSAGSIRWGVRRWINHAMGNAAPQLKNPPEIVRMAGEGRQWFRQMNTPAKPNPMARSATVPSSNEPRSAARIAHAPARQLRKVAATSGTDNFLLTLVKKNTAPPKQAARHKT